MFRKAKTWFLCYLMISSMAFSMAEEENYVMTDEEMENLARMTIKSYQDEVEELIELAPEDPDNDIDNPEKPRLFFLLALLPKIALVLVNLVVKAAPLIIKAVVIVKAKVAACAVAAAAAAKAKALAVAAATAAKFATPAAIKATVISGATKLAKFAVETAVTEAISYGIEKAVESANPQEAEEEEEKPVVDEEPPEPVSSNIFDYYDNNEFCNCTTKRACQCCVEPGRGYKKACLDIRLQDLWDSNSILKIGAFYAGKNIVTRRLSVKEPKQKCLKMESPFESTKMCISIHGRTIVGNRIIQCLSLHFDQRGLTKCLVQNKRGKVWFKSDV